MIASSDDAEPAIASNPQSGVGSGPQHRLENEREHDELHDQLLSAANTMEVNLLFAE